MSGSVAYSPFVRTNNTVVVFPQYSWSFNQEQPTFPGEQLTLQTGEVNVPLYVRATLVLITAWLLLLLAGCGTVTNNNASNSSGNGNSSGGNPPPPPPPPAAGINSVNHIIVITQENRSFDHYFSQLPQYWQANGYPQATNGTTLDVASSTASNPDPNGDIVSLFNLQSACNENPSPSWNESHADRNHEQPTDSGNLPSDTPMDGFVKAAAGDARGNNFYDIQGHRAMGYFSGDQLNYYYFMASNFATSDAWFSPVMSRTQLNRMYLYGATSAGHAYALGVSHSPPLTGKTIFENMQDKNISWRIYVHPDSSGCTSASCLEANSYLNQWTYGKNVLQNLPNNFQPEAQLLTDMQNGTLPQVSFLEPAGYLALDEHASDLDVPAAQAPDVQHGARYIANIINTLMASSSWKDTVLIFTYDEAGGFYDHVPPAPAVPPDAMVFPTDLKTSPPDICLNDTTDPICGFNYTGYRLPLIVVSPFTKKNYVSHTVMDYTAILKFLETRFSLPTLTARDAAQPDMTEFFDFANVPWATPPSNVPKQDTSMSCVLEALSSVDISPNPALAGGAATLTLSLSHAALDDVTVALTASSPGVVPASAPIAAGMSSAIVPITVPTGITSLTVTGSIGGIPVSGTVPVQ